MKPLRSAINLGDSSRGNVSISSHRDTANRAFAAVSSHTYDTYVQRYSNVTCMFLSIGHFFSSLFVRRSIVAVNGNAVAGESLKSLAIPR